MKGLYVQGNSLEGRLRLGLKDSIIEGRLGLSLKNSIIERRLGLSLKNSIIERRLGLIGVFDHRESLLRFTARYPALLKKQRSVCVTVDKRELTLTKTRLSLKNTIIERR